MMAAIFGQVAAERTAFSDPPIENIPMVTSFEDQGPFDFDVFIIGAGSGGIYLSKTLNRLNPTLNIGVAESGNFGGTCVNRGCNPKKTLVRASAFVTEMEEARARGVWNVDAELQWSKLQDWREFKVKWIADLYEGQLKAKVPKSPDQGGITVFEEEASVAEPHKVQIGGDITKTVRLLVLATGGKPKKDNSFPGSDLCITSDQALELQEKPKSMLVVGAGYIAVELASFFMQVGTDVTMSIRSQMLREFDEDIRDIVEDSLIYRNLTIIRGAAITSVVKIDQSNLLKVKFEDGKQIEVETVLQAIGREPMTAGLGLEELGVLDSKKKVPVNKYGQSLAAEWIFAVGDIIAGNPELQPLAIKHGALLPKILLRATAETPVPQMHPAIPDEHLATALFATPRAGSVGLTEAQAKERYGDEAVTVMVQKEGPCCEHLFMWSLMKVIVHDETQRLLGIHIAGKGADETLQAFAIAMRLNPTWKQFSSAMPVHPTITEDIMFMDKTSTRHSQWRLKDCEPGQAGNPLPCGWA